jgi:Trpc4-associated protein
MKTRLPRPPLSPGTFRFWLASCVESFLRGSREPEQIIVAQSGLIDHLVTRLLADQTMVADPLAPATQTNFDLLGELIKFSPTVLDMLDQRIGDDDSFRRLMDHAVTNLVDSNVFLRSVVLTLEDYDARRRGGAYAASGAASGAADGAPMSPQGRRPVESMDAEGKEGGGGEGGQTGGGKGVWTAGRPLARRFAEFLGPDNRMRLLKDVMFVVNIEDVNQENICCLNTAVVFLLFASRRGDLPRCVAAIHELERSHGQRGWVTQNFRKLLWFWQQYYLNRGRDVRLFPWLRPCS